MEVRWKALCRILNRKIRAINAQKITKEKRDTMGALPRLFSKLYSKKTRNYTSLHKKGEEGITVMRTKCK